MIIDCSADLIDKKYGSKKFAETSIPTAIHIDLEKVLSRNSYGIKGRHPLPELPKFLCWLKNKNINNNTTIIAYDRNYSLYSARLWWYLKKIGHNKVHVLDGGLDEWKKNKFNIKKKNKKTYPKQKFYKRISDFKEFSTKFIEYNLRTKKFLLIDARNNDRFNGLNENIDRVAGRIPFSINRFFLKNLDDNGLFKSSQKLNQEFSLLTKNNSPSKIIHQCGSGISACLNLLAMEHANLLGSSVYIGSWSEWIKEKREIIN
jgi:thiosulfate/3-mercaptopyruvate sulfurtransferase